MNFSSFKLIEYHAISIKLPMSTYGLKTALYVSGTYAQCPTNYVSLGGKCLLFLPVVEQSFEEAIYTCMYYGGNLAKISDCNDFGEVANFLESNAGMCTTIE